MKRYYYHVSYYRAGEKVDGVGDVIIDTPEPIKTAQTINRIREVIKADGEDKDATVVILGFTLLRIEDAEPEEVET
jgi:hypothetical protein